MGDVFCSVLMQFTILVTLAWYTYGKILNKIVGTLLQITSIYYIHCNTHLAACTPSHVVLSLIKILSLLIPSASYNLINCFAFSIEPSTSKDNLHTEVPEKLQTFRLTKSASYWESIDCCTR